MGGISLLDLKTSLCSNSNHHYGFCGAIGKRPTAQIRKLKYRPIQRDHAFFFPFVTKVQREFNGGKDSLQ